MKSPKCSPRLLQHFQQHNSHPGPFSLLRVPSVPQERERKCLIAPGFCREDGKSTHSGPLSNNSRPWSCTKAAGWGISITTRRKFAIWVSNSAHFQLLSMDQIKSSTIHSRSRKMIWLINLFRKTTSLHFNRSEQPYPFFIPKKSAPNLLLLLLKSSGCHSALSGLLFPPTVSCLREPRLNIWVIIWIN